MFKSFKSFNQKTDQATEPIGNGQINRSSRLTAALSSNRLQEIEPAIQLRECSKCVIKRRPANPKSCIHDRVIAVPASAQADAASDFYAGKTVNLVIGYAPAGGYDATYPGTPGRGNAPLSNSTVGLLFDAESLFMWSST